MSGHARFNLWTIGLIAFATVVDLFATQAILPAIAHRYAATASEAAAAANACTLGMAVAGLLAAVANRKIPRRAGIAVCLALLAVPTALLAFAQDLTTFAALRVVQGVFMSSAFTLTLAHLGERCTASASPAAFAAYVTGNVVSNLVGRLIAAQTVAMAGLHATFFLFAALNLMGAALAWIAVSRAPANPELMAPPTPALAAIGGHFSTGALRTAFAIGFTILFAFVGTFSYVNFVLAAAPIALPTAALGLVYLVFLPAVATTPAAGATAQRLGARMTISLGLVVAIVGIVLTSARTLPAILAGLSLVGAGTFFAQAAATAFVNRSASKDKAAASGLYLASYYLGGLAGAPVLGRLFETFGWLGCVAGVAAALIVGLLLAQSIPDETASPMEMSHARP